MKKLKLLSTILLISLLAALFIMPTAAISDPTPEANSVVLLDVETGNYLYSKNSDAQLAPASLTKIMTVMLAVEDIELGLVSQNDIVTASGNMVFDLIEDGSTAGIVVGEEMPLEDLLYCAMVESANEACNIIAEYISGSVSQFTSRMNKRAEELGCTGTNFTNTHGLPASGHYTTADDMALIARAAISHPMFIEICNTASITIPATNVAEARHLENTNGLINKNSTAYPGYYYEYAAGIKTGHTEAAGYCLISTAKKDGINLLCVIMGGKSTNLADGIQYGNFSDSINLYNWAFENFSYRDILKVTDLVQDVKVNMGQDADFVSVHPQNAVRALLPNDDDLQSFVQRTTIYSEVSGEELTAPIEAGQVLGEIYLERDGQVYGSSMLVAKNSVELNYSKYISGSIGETLKKPIVVIVFMVVLLLIAGYTFLVVRYRILRKRYMKEHQGKTSRKRSSEVASVQERGASSAAEFISDSAAPNAAELKTATGLSAGTSKKSTGKMRGFNPKSAASTQRSSAPPPANEQQQAPSFKMAPGMPQMRTYKMSQESEALANQDKVEKDYFEEFFGKKD